jgi:hypothetical protein
MFEVTLSAQDRRATTRALLRAFGEGPDHGSVRLNLLKEVTECIPCKATSSVLHLDHFYSKGGKVLRHDHVPALPGGPISKALVKLWLNHISKRDSPVERALCEQSSTSSFGVGSVQPTERHPPLVDHVEWNDSGEGWLARKCNIKHLMYLWTRNEKSGLWAICLRRFSDEPEFTARDVDFLHALGEQLILFREEIQKINLDKYDLGEAERNVLVHWIEYGDGVDEIAKRLHRSPNTVRTQTNRIKTVIREEEGLSDLSMRDIVAWLRQKRS